jgi:ferrochelatase
MTSFESTPTYEHGLPESLGVLLVNLGTPDDATPVAVRRFLSEFLADPRVIEYPRLLWQVVLHGFILRVRPKQSAAQYRKIWTEQGSPLLLHSIDIANALQEKLSARLSGTVNVELAMSYGQPSMDSALERLFEQSTRRLIVLPLYPQYSSSTTGSVFDAVTRALAKRRWVPEFRFINHYHDASGYVSAVAASIRDHWDLNGRGEQLLFSFHGLPVSMLEKGDPYHCQCLKTARLVAELLELEDNAWRVSFQSRVGRDAWLTPFTDETVRKLGSEKLATLDVVTPGFAADCLETLEEIEMQNAGFFRESGGGELRYIPALNARDDHVSFLSRTIEKSIGGWPERSADWSVSEAARQMEKSLQRAKAKGASR